MSCSSVVSQDGRGWPSRDAIGSLSRHRARRAFICVWEDTQQQCQARSASSSSCSRTPIFRHLAHHDQKVKNPVCCTPCDPRPPIILFSLVASFICTSFPATGVLEQVLVRRPRLLCYRSRGGRHQL